MEFRIEHRKCFTIIGFRKRIRLQFEGENHQIDSLLEKITDKVKEELLSINDTDPKGLLNVSAAFSNRTKEGSTLDHYIGVAAEKDGYEGFDSLSVAESDWAIFTAEGKYPEALQNTWASIYSEWLPFSGYTLTGGPEILWNEDEDRTKENFRSEIWIPVRKR